jgi:hypothetical protein
VVVIVVEVIVLGLHLMEEPHNSKSPGIYSVTAAAAAEVVVMMGGLLLVLVLDKREHTRLRPLNHRLYCC